MCHLPRGAVACDLNNLRPSPVLTRVSKTVNGSRMYAVDLTHTGFFCDEVHELIRLDDY